MVVGEGGGEGRGEERVGVEIVGEIGFVLVRLIRGVQPAAGGGEVGLVQEAGKHVGVLKVVVVVGALKGLSVFVAKGV